MAAYAEQVAAGDTGWWRSAVQHAAAWISAQHPTIDLSRQIPLPQLKLQAAALIVYGLSRSRDADPRTISATELLDWVAARQLPMPPGLDGMTTIGDAGFLDQVRLWRHEVDAAADRQQHDLAELLRTAGHPVPAPAHRGLSRFSSDAVVAAWMGMVDTDPPTPGPVSMMDAFPAPLLSLALSALGD